MNFIKLVREVSDKPSAVSFLQKYNILPQSRQCVGKDGKPHPSRDMSIKFQENGDCWRCPVGGCRKEMGLRKGTWLENTKLELPTVVHLIYAWSRKYTSCNFCHDEFGFDDHTTVDWNHMFREVCAVSVLQNPSVLGGRDMVVEIDESLFSRRKYNVGRLLPQQWVFGGVCRDTKECFLYAVPNRKAETLLPIIQQSIRPGSIIISDDYRSYDKIEDLGMGYKHLTVNHSKNFVDPKTGACTNRIEGVCNLAKSENRRRWGTHRSMIDSYLCEFAWRQRKENLDPFEAILYDIAHFQEYVDNLPAFPEPEEPVSDQDSD